MPRHLLIGTAAIAIAGTAEVASASMLSIIFQPSAQVVQLGDTATVDMYAEVDAGLLGLFDFVFDFATSGDPILDDGSVSLDAAWFDLGNPFDRIAGTILDINNPPTGTVFLGSITFNTTALGTARVDASSGSSSGIPEFQLASQFNDPQQVLVDFDDDGTDLLDLSQAFAEITVIQVIPLPAPVAMAGIGLLGVGLARRRLRG